MDKPVCKRCDCVIEESGAWDAWLASGHWFCNEACFRAWDEDPEPELERILMTQESIRKRLTPYTQKAMSVIGGE